MELGYLLLRDLVIIALRNMQGSKTKEDLISAISEVDQIMSNARDTYRFVDREKVQPGNFKHVIVEKINLVTEMLVHLVNKLKGMNRVNVLQGETLVEMLALTDMLIQHKLPRIIHEMNELVTNEDEKRFPDPVPAYDNLDAKAKELHERFLETQVKVYRGDANKTVREIKEQPKQKSYFSYRTEQEIWLHVQERMNLKDPTLSS